MPQTDMREGGGSLEGKWLLFEEDMKSILLVWANSRTSKYCFFAGLLPV